MSLSKAARRKTSVVRSRPGRDRTRGGRVRRRQPCRERRAEPVQEHGRDASATAPAATTPLTTPPAGGALWSVVRQPDGHLRSCTGASAAGLARRTPSYAPLGARVLSVETDAPGRRDGDGGRERSAATAAVGARSDVVRNGVVDDARVRA